MLNPIVSLYLLRSSNTLLLTGCLVHHLWYTDIFKTIKPGMMLFLLYFSFPTELSCSVITGDAASLRNFIWSSDCGHATLKHLTPLQLQSEDCKLKCRPLCTLQCWGKSWVWWTAMPPRARHVEREDQWLWGLSRPTSDKDAVFVYIGLSVSLWHEHFTAHAAPVSLFAASLCV